MIYVVVVVGVLEKSTGMWVVDREEKDTQKASSVLLLSGGGGRKTCHHHLVTWKWTCHYLGKFWTTLTKILARW